MPCHAGYGASFPVRAAPDGPPAHRALARIPSPAPTMLRSWCTMRTKTAEPGTRVDAGGTQGQATSHAPRRKSTWSRTWKRSGSKPRPGAPAAISSWRLTKLLGNSPRSGRPTGRALSCGSATRAQPKRPCSRRFHPARDRLEHAGALSIAASFQTACSGDSSSASASRPRSRASCEAVLPAKPGAPAPTGLRSAPALARARATAA